MSRIVHLENGAAIKADVIESFDQAVGNMENRTAGRNFWNFVKGDMYYDMAHLYARTYIDECFDRLADVMDSTEAHPWRTSS